MKKVLSLFMLLCTVFTGAWAGYQVGTTPISTKDALTDGIYALEIRTKTYTGWLLYADGDEPFRVTRSNAMTAFTAGERIVTDTKYLWKVTNGTNGFSLQCVSNDEYISNRGGTDAGRGNVRKVGSPAEAVASTSFVLSDPADDNGVKRFNIWKTQDGQLHDAYPYLHANDGSGQQILSYWEGGNMNNMNDGTAIKVAFYPVEEGSFEIPKAVENGIYEIKNVSNEGNGVGRGYLIDYTSWANGPTIGDCPWSDYTSKHPTTHNDGTTTSSYWYVYNNVDGTVSIFSLSALSGNDYPKFLNVPTTNAKSTWSDLPVHLNIDDNTSKSGSFSIRNANGTSYLSMGCGTNANQGATATDAMTDGGTQLSFVAVQESALTDDQRYIKNYGIGVIEGTAPAVRVSNKNVHSFQINCNGSTANYFNPFTFPTQTESERGVFQLYRVGETAKVYIKEAGSGKYLAYSNTGSGTKKISLTDQAGASQFTVVNNTTYYNIGPSSSTSFNWFGGVGVDPYRIGTDDVMNTIGFYSATDGNSKWRLNEVSGDAATTAINNSAAFYLATLKNKALTNASRIGEGLGKYNFNNGQTEGFEDVVNACIDEETLNTLIASIALNMPKAGTLLRMKGVVNTSKYLLGTQTNSGSKYSMGTAKDATSIFYYDGSKLISYNTGLYVGTTSSKWQWNLGDGVNIVFHAASTQNAYRIQVPQDSGDKPFIFLYSGAENASNADRGGFSSVDDCTDTKYQWTLEEVTELPISLSAIDGHAYGTLYTPVALDLSDTYTYGLLYAYAVEVNGDKAVMKNVGEVIPPNTGVVLYGNVASFVPAYIEVGGTSTYDGTNALEGVIATTNTIPTGGVMTMQNYSESGIGFYSFTGTTLKGFKAYLPKSAGVKAFSFNFEEEQTTAIVNAIAAQNTGIAYDLTGRQVRANAKGINIENGKKVIR